MAQYSIREKGLSLISRNLKRECQRKSNRGLSVWLKTLAMVPVTAILLIATPSIAGSYHFLPTPGSDETIDINTAPQSSTSHSSILAAAFGFQVAGSSIITVRTYDGPTGAILSEDSFDVNIKEEGKTEHNANKGRIFAGGVGTDSDGQAKFMLHVYDAETGHFLWEGQLNLLKAGEGGVTKAQVTARSNGSSMIRTLSNKQAPFQILFSLRAVNLTTGALLWQDQFAPGSSRERKKGAGVALTGPGMNPIGQPMERVFDLVVRTYDRTTGTLLWQDAFEQLDGLDDPTVEPYSDAFPQAIPPWTPSARGNEQGHQMTLR